MGIDREDVIFLDFETDMIEEKQSSESCCIFRMYRNSLKEIVEEAE